MIRIVSFLILFCFLAPQAGWSQTGGMTEVPGKTDTTDVLSREILRASLLTAWEQNVQKDPDTRAFQKTTTPNVYYVETDILHYKGHIRVTNLLIRPYPPTAEYDKKIAYGGVVETEFLDNTGNLPGKDSLSAKEWGRLSWFNYDKSTDEWFPTSAWQEHFPNTKYAKFARIDTPISKIDSSLPTFMDVIIMVTEAVFGVFFVMLLGVAGLYGYRQQKIRETMNEHTQILKDILTAIRDK